MADIFGQWLHAVIYTGVVCSIALMLSPDGRVKNALKILCAVAMCAAIVSPLSELDFDAYSKAMARCKLDAEQYADQGEQYSKNLNRTIIEDECRAYILDKAAQCGAVLDDAQVTLQWSTDGYWYPQSVRLVTSGPAAENSRLAQIIEADLGVPRTRQEWSSTS